MAFRVLVLARDPREEGVSERCRSLLPSRFLEEDDIDAGNFVGVVANIALVVSLVVYQKGCRAGCRTSRAGASFSPSESEARKSG